MSDPDIAAPLRIAYADPPYVGQAKKHYGKEVSYAGEVDHAELAMRLRAFDGWALSASSPSLHVVLPLFPDARIGGWFKPFASFKPGVNPAFAWEPVLFKPARPRGREVPTERDWVGEWAHVENITLKKGLSGAKPPRFCVWLFEILGARPRDEFVDLFPGTGAVTSAWERWKVERAA